ncbi:MAG: hypothetical protein HOV94_26580 [Saccharothrix sp.]|nr:hypothetical protein [Saccharothrix sp.]
MGNTPGKSTKRKHEPSTDRRPAPVGRARLAQALSTLTTPGRTTETISRRWRGGTAQLHDEWCYAAIEETILTAFGLPSESQEERAYRDIRDRCAIGDTAQMPPALRKLLGLVPETAVELPPYAEAKRRYGKKLTAALGGAPGMFRLDRDEITVRQSAELSLEEVRATIDADGLIAFGDAAHWRVIFGYTSDDRVLVFDPFNGGKEEVWTWERVSEKWQFGYHVT